MTRSIRKWETMTGGSRRSDNRNTTPRARGRPEADEEAGVEEGDDPGQGPGEPGAARTLRRPPVAQEDDVDAEQLSAERDPQDGAGKIVARRRCPGVIRRSAVAALSARPHADGVCPGRSGKRTTTVHPATTWNRSTKVRPVPTEIWPAVRRWRMCLILLRLTWTKLPGQLRRK